MRNQQRTETQCDSIKLCCRAGVLLALGVLLTFCPGFGQSGKSPLSEGVYTNAKLAFRYILPDGMHDKTGLFPGAGPHILIFTPGTTTIEAAPLAAVSASGYHGPIQLGASHLTLCNSAYPHLRLLCFVDQH